mmetsp:Transcript_45994/g.109253  ORF Transcript_45994/g.109253 Transcript_45994/m.109253 type:complete len:287 (-) Transcript_45994:596-1456(-)
MGNHWRRTFGHLHSARVKLWLPRKRRLPCLHLTWPAICWELPLAHRLTRLPVRSTATVDGGGGAKRIHQHRKAAGCRQLIGHWIGFLASRLSTTTRCTTSHMLLMLCKPHTRCNRQPNQSNQFHLCSQCQPHPHHLHDRNPISYRPQRWRSSTICKRRRQLQPLKLSGQTAQIPVRMLRQKRQKSRRTADKIWGPQNLVPSQTQRQKRQTQPKLRKWRQRWKRQMQSRKSRCRPRARPRRPRGGAQKPQPRSLLRPPRGRCQVLGTRTVIGTWGKTAIYREAFKQL